MEALLVAALLCRNCPEVMAAMMADELDCGAYMQAHQIPQPVLPVSDDQAERMIRQSRPPFTLDSSLLGDDVGIPPLHLPYGPCSKQQMAMMVANTDALARGQPVIDPVDLYGTWLSDDVLNEQSGVGPRGQEVLVITPVAPDDRPATAPDAPAIALRQYWFADLPHPVWDEDGGYAGLNAEGILSRRDDGSFAQAPYRQTVTYPGVTFGEQRAEDLRIKGKLNFFDDPVSFARDGDVLVLNYDLPSAMGGDGLRGDHTYTRVADDAPVIALRMVDALDISAPSHFDCLVHGISRQDPALMQELSPFSVAQFDSLMQQVIGLRAQLAALREDERNGRAGDDILDQLRGFQDQERGLRVQIRPVEEKLIARAPVDLCPLIPLYMD